MRIVQLNIYRHFPYDLSPVTPPDSSRTSVIPGGGESKRFVSNTVGRPRIGGLIGVASVPKPATLGLLLLGGLALLKRRR